MDNPVLVISPNDMEWLRGLAHLRHDPKQAFRDQRGIVKERMGDFKQIDVEINGLMAEYAVAFYLNGRIDDNFYWEGDGAIGDLVVSGTEIQVKATFYKSGKLFFNFKDGFKAHYAVLCEKCRENEIRICGYIEKGEFLSECQYYNFGYGDRWGVPQSKLHPIQELRNELI